MAAFDGIQVPWQGWKIVKKIGQGNYGAVYEIERKHFSRTEKAAMKVISIPRDENEYDMMLISADYNEDSVRKRITDELHKAEKEYSVMQDLDGRGNIVRYDDFAFVKHEDAIGYTVFIRMELMKSLHAVIREKRTKNEYFSERETVKLGKDICVALIACGKKEIIHRDIKPGNILVSSRGKYSLGDFGIARNLDHSTYVTIAGTLPFMAPEVFRMERTDKTADIYSLGLVMYWLMNNNRMPFVSQTGIPSADDIAKASNRRLSGESLPAPCNSSKELSSIILKACAYRKEDRYRTPAEMLTALVSVERGNTADNNVQVKEYTDDPDRTFIEDNTVTHTGISPIHYQRSKEPDAPRTEPKTAVKTESAEELYRRGLSYHYGRGVERNYSKAAEWYLRAAEQGHAAAQCNLGYLFNNGLGVQKNYRKAAEWYQKAAEQGHMIAQCNLGYLYSNGNGVKKNSRKAAEWYRKSAEQGYANAQYQWGAFLYDIERNQKKAAEWYHKAAAQGHAGAQFELGYLHSKGYGVEQSYSKAVEWYRKAADQGIARAHHNLGYLYENGHGVERSLSKAAERYRKAAELGDVEARDRLIDIQKKLK